MPELKTQQTSPYTRERAKLLQRSYVRLNSFGLAVMCIGHVAIGLMYSDVLISMYFSAFVFLGFIYGLIWNSIPHNLYILLGEVLAIFGVAGAQFVMPEGAASAVLIFPLGVTLLAFSQTIFRGVFSFLIGLAVFFSFGPIGFESFSLSESPSLVSFLMTVFYSGFVLTYQVSKARRSVESALGSLVETESELTSTERALNEYEQKLVLINVELAHQNETLMATLSKESETNAALELERASQEELTKAIHTDLREPLGSIVTASKKLAGILNEIPEAKPVESYMGFAIDGAKRMAQMLDDLLDYTKDTPLQKVEQVDLNGVLNTLQFDLSDLVKRSNATIDVGELPAISGFSTQLTQLFQNLLTNALKFSRPGVPPKVVVKSAEIQDKDGYFMVRVLDNGIGIPANQLASVFGLFNRVHSEDGYEGSGVGLALCRRIAVAHDAELTVSSIYGEGTQFTISFPTSSVVSAGKVNLSNVSKTIQHELS